MAEYKQGKRKVIETVSIEINPLLSGRARSDVVITIKDGKLDAIEFLDLTLRGDNIEIAKTALKAVDDEMFRRNNRPD